MDFAEAFASLNARRRAIRHFRAQPVSDAVIESLVAAAQLAPSSNNSQPYQFICIRTPAEKAEAAKFCRDQRAAATAPILIAVACGRSYAAESLEAFARHVPAAYEGDSLAYHRSKTRQARLFLAIGHWPIWSPLVALAKLISPSSTLLPLGPDGIRHWCTRSAIFAAQTLMLAASAAGLDTCPMEGFKPAALARYLKLPSDVVIPLVIAVGYAAEDARIEPRWRKPFDLAARFL